MGPDVGMRRDSRSTQAEARERDLFVYFQLWGMGKGSPGPKMAVTHAATLAVTPVAQQRSPGEDSPWVDDRDGEQKGDASSSTSALGRDEPCPRDTAAGLLGSSSKKGSKTVALTNPLDAGLGADSCSPRSCYDPKTSSAFPIH